MPNHGWFFIWNHHDNYAYYASIMSLFDNANSTQEKELLVVESIASRGDRPATICFLKSNKELLKSRLEQFNRLKAFL